MKALFILLFSLCLLQLSAQKCIDPDKIKTFNIVVNYDDHTVKTQMLKDCKKVKIVNDRTYLWCSANKIIETRAGYDGKLLHGYYKSFYFENNQLRESGTVKYGLRSREWRYWYADGRLREIVTYKNGKKNGAYMLYNDYGNLMAKGKFKNNQLHGRFYTYSNTGAIQDKKRYKHGVEVIAPVKSAKTKTLKLPKLKKAKKLKTEQAESPAPVEKQKKAKKPAKSAAKEKTDPGKSWKERIRTFFHKKEKAASTVEKKSDARTV